MIRLTDAICITFVTLSLLWGSTAQAQIAPQGASIVDHYLNLFNGHSASAGSISYAQPLEIVSAPSIDYLPSTNYLPANDFVSPEVFSDVNHVPVFQPNVQQPVYNDILDTRNYRLLDYRRMFQNGRTPQPHEMIGYWRGVNKGIVELVGYRQFIKEILPSNNGVISGDNIKVGQVNQDLLRSLGWQPTNNPLTGEFERNGKFAIQPPQGRGFFGNGAVFSYRDGGNRRSDPANLLVDQVVMLDANHMLGRATANFGPVKIPLAYFVLERIQ